MRANAPKQFRTDLFWGEISKMKKGQQWFRLYTDVVNDPKVQRLGGESFKFWVNVLCIAALHDGAIPPLDELAFQIRMKPAECQRKLHELLKIGLLDHGEGETLRPHNWDERQFKSDVSTERVRALRERKRNVSSAVSETRSDTEQIQSRAETESETEQKQNSASSSPNSATPPKRDPIALENVSGFMRDFFHGERGEPDSGIVRRVHDALGFPVTEDAILEFAQFLQNKRSAGTFPKTWGLFVNWAKASREARP